eukprot:CAMPEP_0175938626 /NCGR_PEP_ID=MMETSP0108-20121206/22801_1 /TAXON_ID=195067 ORGANISM="Goniomonas pacifica, Strain CCMP1869" /NCGR_SAMPLE_ID=MMETSP0108 /ASSEMBLY_ACC=CAM_ASM_000204 /LENGTH=259 /DNA_ID=CAMNT_0017262899 /DNA_START=8 /DNA_END=787 /DNA_ORIENTATION=-
MASLDELRKQLNSKGTFISAMASIEETVRRDGLSPDAFGVVQRAASLLRSRYTLPVYFKAGASLFRTCLEFQPSDQQTKSLQEWVELTQQHSEEAPTQPTQPTQPAASYGDDGMQHTERAAPQFGDLNATQNLLAQLLSGGILTDFSFGDSDFEAGDFDTFDAGPPPASRDARFNLPTTSVEGKEPLCAVCQENFPPKGKAKQLPCGHLFHYDCCMEWLEKRNTCPMCRYQLPTEKVHHDDVADRVAARDPTAGSAVYS